MRYCLEINFSWSHNMIFTRWYLRWPSNFNVQSLYKGVAFFKRLHRYCWRIRVTNYLSPTPVNNIDVAFQTLQPITCNPILSSCQFLALNPLLFFIFLIFRNRMRLGQDGRNLSEWIRPWFCGLGSGVMDISITFPINKVMFRQQLNGITSKQAINQLKGIRPRHSNVCDPPCIHG